MIDMTNFLYGLAEFLAGFGTGCALFAVVFYHQSFVARHTTRVINRTQAVRDRWRKRLQAVNL